MPAKNSASKPVKKSPRKPASAGAKKKPAKAMPASKGSKASPTAAVSPTSGPSAKKTGSGATKATKRPLANDAPHEPPAVASPVPAQKRAPVPLAKSNPRNHPKHLSAIDAAAQVLAEAKAPMTTKQLVETMAQRGLWKSATGKTPEATLYAAIHREISKKKAEARFRKTGRGLFELAT